MAKAGYMPFDTEDRLEIFTSKRSVMGGVGGFDQQSGAADDDWRGGGQHSPGSGVSVAPAAASTSGLDVWPSAYCNEIGEPWARQQQQHQQAGGGAQQDLRQVCGLGRVASARVCYKYADPLYSCLLHPEERHLKRTECARVSLLMFFLWLLVVFACRISSVGCVCVMPHACCRQRICHYLGTACFASTSIVLSYC